MPKKGKYGKWSQFDLEKAIRTCKNNEAGLNECQRRYYVPKITLKHHLENKNKVANHQTKVLGRATDFDQEIEDLLVQHAVQFTKPVA
jgi:hypothetical protein